MTAIYKRFGKDVEHDMPMRYEITKGSLCMLLDIDDEEFVYILDGEGNTVATMLTGQSKFTPPAAGVYTVKTNSDLNNAAGTVLNPLEFMWRGMRHLNRFPLNLATVNTYMLAQIMKKMEYKSFVNVARTCKGLKDIPKEHPKQFCLGIPFYFHIGIFHEGGGTSGCISTHFEDFWTRPHPRAKHDKDYEIPLTELEHIQPFNLEGLTIDQPNREDFTGFHRMEELSAIAKAVVDAQTQYKTLFIERCTMMEVVGLLIGLKPKKANIRMCSFDKKNGELTQIYHMLLNLFHSVAETYSFTLPEELLIVSPDFFFLNLYPREKTMCDFIGQVRVFQACALSTAAMNNHHETPCFFIEEFGAGKDLGKNKVAMFVLRTRETFLNHFFVRPDQCGLSFENRLNNLDQPPGEIRVCQCIIRNQANQTLLHQTRLYRYFATYTFVEYKGSLEKGKGLIESAHKNLDDLFVNMS